MNELSAARRRLAAALEPILPGRVHAYKPAKLARGVAPAIWLDEEAGAAETIGNATRVVVATFPVTCLADGADHSAQAMAESLAAAVWDVAAATAGCEPRGWEPVGVAVDPNVVLRGRLVDVAVRITARTLCPPEVVVPVPIPPELVEV